MVTTAPPTRVRTSLPPSRLDLASIGNCLVLRLDHDFKLGDIRHEMAFKKSRVGRFRTTTYEYSVTRWSRKCVPLVFALWQCYFRPTWGRPSFRLLRASDVDGPGAEEGKSHAASQSKQARKHPRGAERLPACLSAMVARWQNLIPSFPWIAPGWRAWGWIASPRPPPWHNPRKGRDQIL